MSWVPCRERMPTESDEDESGRVFWRCQSGYTFCGRYNNARTDLVAWMSIPGFTPLPDPPDGYEILTDYDQELHPDAKQLDSVSRRWVPHWTRLRYIKSEIYAVPIKPPEPRHRPFANAEEFKPYRNRWWRTKGSDRLMPPSSYSETNFASCDWQHAFETLEFEGSHPFGVKIQD